jgi:pyridoxine kinase
VSIISLQSSVAYGHVGNSAAVFALRRLGCDVWPIDTVRVSNHPGYGRFRGRRIPTDEAEEIVLGLADVGVLADATGVLSGYLGSAAMGEVLTKLVERVCQGKPQARVCLDPVMGDHGRGLYVEYDLVDFFRGRGLALANVLTPNHFELEVLAGRPLPDVAAVIAASGILLQSGPDIVVVTSVPSGPDSLATLAIEPDAVWQVTTPRIDHLARGAGDLLAALFFAHHLAGQPTETALARAVASVFAVIAATAAAGSRELRLVAAQDALPQPPELFPSIRIG